MLLVMRLVSAGDTNPSPDTPDTMDYMAYKHYAMIIYGSFHIKLFEKIINHYPTHETHQKSGAIA